ncbi:hypothetical protein V8C42DRAFT_163735 [Trichoderma barbatum]
MCIAVVLIFFLPYLLVKQCKQHAISRRPAPETRGRFVGLAPKAVDSIPLVSYSVSPHERHVTPSQASHNSGSDDSPNCSICTEMFEEGIRLRSLPCGHLFHPTCVDPWLLERSVTCPLCRRNLTSGFLSGARDTLQQPRRTFSASVRRYFLRREPRNTPECPPFTSIPSVHSLGPGTAMVIPPLRLFSEALPSMPEGLEQESSTSGEARVVVRNG